MTFLLDKDYHSIIEFAIGLNEKDIPHYFFSEYQNHSSTNSNFVRKLKDTLSELENRFQILIQQYNKRYLKEESRAKENQIENEVKKISDWDNESFWYYEGVVERIFPIAWHQKQHKRITIKKFKEIKSGFENFNKMTIESKKINTIEQSQTLKLDWKGQKNQLYQVLRDLKQQELISNSYNQLADFLIQNVVGFNNTSKETIEKELKKDKPLPKNKRVNISTLGKLK